jgi:hypothetical protein
MFKLAGEASVITLFGFRAEMFVVDLIPPHTRCVSAILPSR